MMEVDSGNVDEPAPVVISGGLPPCNPSATASGFLCGDCGYVRCYEALRPVQTNTGVQGGKRHPRERCHPVP